jgi:hypothetical protein
LVTHCDHKKGNLGLPIQPTYLLLLLLPPFHPPLSFEKFDEDVPLYFSPPIGSKAINISHSVKLVKIFFG